MHRCDVVYHLAAAVGVRLIVEQPGRTLLTNVQGAENVLEYCARFEKPVLIASSSEVYGNHPEDVLLEENAQRIYGPTTAKRWAYADTKALDEFLALALRHERGLRCVIARLFNTVGPRQSSQYGNVIPRFVQSALAGEPLEIHGDGSQTRCFCHVSDVVRALRGLLELGRRRDLQRRVDRPDHDPRPGRAGARGHAAPAPSSSSCPTTRSSRAA